MSQNIQVGDSVRTTKQLYFYEAIHPKTGNVIEFFLPRWHRLTVTAIDTKNDTINVQLPDGYIAELPGDFFEH